MYIVMNYQYKIKARKMKKISEYTPSRQQNFQHMVLFNRKKYGYT